MLASMIFPLVQLVILGNAFGGKIRDAKMAIVDQDGGPQAVRVKEAFDSVHANIRTFVAIPYNSEKKAVEDVRDGKLQGAVIIPPQFSRRIYEENHPRIALIVDNSDNFMSSALESEMTDLTNALNQPTISPRILQQTALDTVELYPYIEYMKYLLPGSLSLAMFVSVMIGGGMLYIDDKARGVHEGYLVTPITKLELVLGLNLAGTIKAVMTGIIICVIGSLIAGVSTIFNPITMLGLLVMIILTSLAFNTMMFLLMVRIEDPLVPRALFGILNTLLFFPSGSIYPIQAFPKWLRVIAHADPFTYAVDGFKCLLLKETTLSAVWGDMLFLSIFAAVTLGIAIPLFKRTL
jgi:ABC-2 type transport system permease protein